MRTVSPEQSTPFIIAFDTALKRGLERILGAQLDCTWWRQAQLPLKYGRMGPRTALVFFLVKLFLPENG